MMEHDITKINSNSTSQIISTMRGHKSEVTGKEGRQKDIETG